MNIRTLFDNKKPVFSLEIFPPKRSSSIDSIYSKLDSFMEVKPDYISVTFGAGGSENENLTCKLASDIKTKYGVEPLAHLTCIHSTRQQIDAQLNALKNAGIENILALRGDRVEGMEPTRDFVHASDLAAYIKDFGGFNIVGACYPEGHPECSSRGQDTFNLRYKVDAGVTHLNSQLFFSNDDFYAFLERLRAAGINVPVEAGIMAVTNKNQIERMVSLCGASLPAKFTRIMARYESNPAALFDAGIAYAVNQIVDLIGSGVDGIHLYTMNNPEVALRIYSAVRNLLN